MSEELCIAPETVPVEPTHVIVLTDRQATALSGLIGYAMGSLAKDGITHGGAADEAVDSFIVQLGGYPYFTPRSEVLAKIERAKAGMPKL